MHESHTEAGFCPRVWWEGRRKVKGSVKNQIGYT